MENFDEKKWILRQIGEQNWDKIKNYAGSTGFNLETQSFLFDEYNLLVDSDNKDLQEKRKNLRDVLCKLSWTSPMFPAVHQFRIEQTTRWEAYASKDIHVSVDEEILFCRHVIEEISRMRMFLFDNLCCYAEYRSLQLQTQRFLCKIYNSLESEAQKLYEDEEKRAYYVSDAQERIAKVLHSIIAWDAKNEKRELIPEVSILIVKHHLYLESQIPWFRLTTEAEILMTQYYSAAEIAKYFILGQIKDFDNSEVIPLLNALKDQYSTYNMGIYRGNAKQDKVIWNYSKYRDAEEQIPKLFHHLLLTDMTLEVEAEAFSINKEFFFIRLEEKVLKGNADFIFTQDQQFQNKFWRYFEWKPELLSCHVQEDLLCKCSEEQSIHFLKICDSSFPGQVFWTPEVEYAFSQCTDRPQAQNLYLTVFGDNGYFGNWNKNPEGNSLQDAEVLLLQEEITPEGEQAKTNGGEPQEVVSDTFRSNNLFSRLYHFLFS